MLKAFSKSRSFCTLAFIGSLLGAVNSETTSTNILQGKNLEVWEQSESRKIFGEARRYQLESNLIEALKLYSEILEFFPDTDVWPLACIQLSDIYLHRKNIPASEKVLKRLVSYRSQQGLIQDENTLLAQWDFFEKLKRVDDLILWLEKRNAQEKEKLRDSNALKTRIFSLARNEELVSLTQLQQLFTAQGYEKSLQALVGLMDNPDFLYSETRHKELMDICILEEDLSLMRKIVTSMQKSGWGNLAHKTFIDFKDHPKAITWQRLWVQLLIDGQMWPEVEALLKQLPKKEWSREILLTSIGQGKWGQAFLEFKDMEEWIFSSLSVEDLHTFAKGLQQDSNQKSLYDEFIDMIPKSGKKNLLLATLSKDKNVKITLLESLKQDSVYDKTAILELGKIYQKERQLDKIKALYNELHQKDPNCKEIKELKLILDTINSLQKVQPPKNTKKLEVQTL